MILQRKKKDSHVGGFLDTHSKLRFTLVFKETATGMTLVRCEDILPSPNQKAEAKKGAGAGGEAQPPG